MNLLLLSEPSYPRHPGGSGKSTHLLAAGLAARGHDVRILCGSDRPTEVERLDGVEVHRLCWPEPRDEPEDRREAATAGAVRRYVEAELDPASLDVVYDSGVFLSYFFPVAFALRRGYGAAYIAHYRYLLEPVKASEEPPGRYAPLSRSALWLQSQVHDTSQGFPARFADAVVCPSRGAADYVEAFFRPACGAPAVVPDPVAVATPGPAEAARWRSAVVGEDEDLVLFPGRVDDEGKGGRVVREAFERIRGKRPRARLLLLVRSDSWLEPFRTLGDAVVSRPWIHDPEELATVFAAADVVVMPSVYESFGMVGAEALGAGTPVVASPVGAMPELVRDGENGFLLGAGDPARWPAQLADRVLRILEAPPPRSLMERCAREVREACSPRRVAERVEAICLGAREPRSPAPPIAPPRLTVAETERYVDLVGELLGSRAEPAARAVLEGWEDTAEERCRACTWSRMARNLQALMQMRRGRPARLWATVRGPVDGRLGEVVDATCPLSLLQRAAWGTPSRVGPARRKAGLRAGTGGTSSSDPQASGSRLA